MLLLNTFYLKYFFFITKKFHFLWNAYNFNLIIWDIRKNHKSSILFLKSPLWIFYFSSELESFVIIYYLLKLNNSNTPLTIFGSNFHIFFRGNFFIFNINFFSLQILKIFKTYFKLIMFNVKWILLAAIISIIYFFFLYFIFN